MTKPIVHYRGEVKFRDGRAYLHPIDHPNHIPGQLVSNTKEVCTSPVLGWDKATGRVETTYTVYMPV